MMVSSLLKRMFVLPNFVAVAIIGIIIIGGVCEVHGEAVEPPLSEPNVVPIDYNHNGDALQGFVATPSASSDGPFPAVVIIPYVVISLLSLPFHCRHKTQLFLFYFSIAALCKSVFSPTNQTSTKNSEKTNSDWDGVNFYEQVRATLMATEYNWVGFAADIYGASLHNVTDIDQRIELSTLYRSNATLFSERIQAAVDVVKTLDSVDPDKIALLG
jgi:hypothetical protein